MMFRRPLKKLAIFLLGSAALLLVALSVLPMLLGTKWIYQPLVDRLAADDFVVSVEGVRVRWFSPLKFERIEIKQSDGAGLLSIAEIRSDRGLFGYLIGGRQIGRIEILRPVVDVRLLEDSTNLTRFIKAIEGKTQASSAGKPRGKLRVDVEVAISGASAKLQRDGESQALVVIPEFDINLEYLAAQGASKLRVAPTQVLTEVELTPELIELGLGYAVPLLAQSAWFDGKVSLAIQEIEVPLDEPLQTTGDAVLTLHTVRSGPSQPAIVHLLDFMAQLRGRQIQHEFVFVDGSQIALGVRNGVVSHSGLKIGLPRLDSRLQLESSGSVSFIDKQLALKLKVPIPVEQLARRDQVKELGVPQLELPIGGTLDNPVVEWGAMREASSELIGLIRSKLGADAPGMAAVLGALEGLSDGQADQTITAATEWIGQLRDRRRASQAAAEAQQPESASVESETAESQRPLRGALRGWLRGKKDSP